MQVRKVAVVATGALATAAAMGSTPAFAADSEGTPEVAPATLGVLDYEGKHRASDEAMRELAEQWLTVAPEQTTTWPAPWEQDSQVLSVGDGSALSLAALQMCGSHGPLAGGVSVPVDSPATVLGDCRNGNVAVNGDGGDDEALFSVLNGAAISALPIQMCGSGAGIAGATVPIASPATVGGSCDNGNISISDDDDPDDPGYGYYEPLSAAEGATAQTEAGASAEAETQAAEASEVSDEAEAAAPRAEQTMVGPAPWEQDSRILSVGDGSAVSALSAQMCGSHGPLAVGASAPIDSPSTVLGDCRNGNLDIHGDGDDSDALFDILNGSAVSAGAIQMCGSGAGIGGATVPIASPATVDGNCDNGNVVVG